MGDVRSDEPRVWEAPEPPNRVTLPGEDQVNWSSPVRAAVTAVAEEALAHPGDPAYWKPSPPGWLAQGSHEGQALVVMVDGEGTVHDAWSGAFSQSTKTSAADAVSALHALLDGAKVVDPDHGVIALTLPSGSTIDVQVAVDPSLAEGATFVAPPSYELTPTGWRQTDPATVVLSATVRADQGEISQDIGSHLVHALLRLDGSLPGPVSDSPVRPDAGRAPKMRGARIGDTWQAPTTVVRVDAPEGLGTDLGAGDRLAAAVAALQSGGRSDAPVVAITGDPSEGVKLAHFPDGSSVAFIVETTGDLPSGAVEVTPANWLFDGETMRQAGEPARLRLSDQISTADEAGAKDMVQAMLDAGLTGLRDSAPTTGLPHQRNNVLDLQELGDALNLGRDQTDIKTDRPVFVLPDPLAPFAAQPEVTGRFLVRTPSETEFTSGTRSVVDALERAGYRVVSMVDGWSTPGPPGLVVQVRPPGAEAMSRAPLELRLLAPEGLDAYRAIAADASHRRLPADETLLRMAEHPDLAPPPRTPTDPARWREAPALAEAGAETGLDPTPTTVAHGTVRMEEHPGFPALRQKLEDLGFPLVPVQEAPGSPQKTQTADIAPHVEIREIYDGAGQLLRIEREVQVHAGMRFLDLEHEADHVYQMTERFPEGPPATTVWTQAADGSLKEIKNAPTRMKDWQNTIIEYHVRLQEYIRLAERRVDPEVLAPHLAAVDQWARLFRDKGIKGGRSPSRLAWVAEHFADLAALQKRVAELRSRPPDSDAASGPEVDRSGQADPPMAKGRKRVVPPQPVEVTVVVPDGLPVAPNPAAVNRVVVDLLPRMPGTGQVPGLEAVHQLAGSQWEVSQQGRVIEMEVVAREDLPAGEARVAPGRLEVSANVPDGRVGDLLNAVLLTEAMRAHGELLGPANATGAASHTGSAGATGPPRSPAGPSPGASPATAGPSGHTPAARGSTAGGSALSQPAGAGPGAGSMPMRLRIPTYGEASAPQPTAVREVIQRLLPQLTQRVVPGLEGIEATADPTVWSFTYNGTTAPVRVTVSTGLPAGQVVVEAGAIILSGQAVEGQAGALITAAALRQALAAYGDLVGAGRVVHTAPDGGTPVSGPVNVEQPGLPGHGGPQDPQGNREEAIAAARWLAARHPDLPGTGYQLRTINDPVLDLLLVAQAPDAPPAAFRFASGNLMNDAGVAQTSSTSLLTADRVPIFEIMVSDQIPIAQRVAVTRRVVAHEVAAQLDRLRRSQPSRRWQRLGWHSGERSVAHDSGLVGELRLELAERAAAANPAVHDRRIGQLLSRPEARDRLDQILTELATTGHGSDVDVVRQLVDPSASWRSEVAAERRAEARAALIDVMSRLSDPQVRLFSHADLQADVVEVTTLDGATVEVPIAAQVAALAGLDAVGERLRARATVEFAAAFVEAAESHLTAEWSVDPTSAAVQALARVHGMLPTELRTEHLFEINRRLDRLTADQLATVRWQLSPNLSRDMPRRIAETLFAETLTTLSGDGPMALASEVRRRPDGGLTLTGRMRGRRVTAGVVSQLTDWLHNRIVDGAGVDRARAEAAGVLGAELGAVGRARQPRLVGALQALGRLWQDPALPPGVRAAVEAFTGEVLRTYTLRPSDWRVLPQAARDLVIRAPDAGLPDPYAPLRPRSQQELVQRVNDELTGLADGLTGGASSWTGHANSAARSAGQVATVLAEAQVGLNQRAEARAQAAEAAREKANEKETEYQQAAPTRRQVRDRWANERREDARLEAAVAQANADRHARITDRYERARELAGVAREAYQELAADLAAFGSAPDSSPNRFAQVQRVAERAHTAFTDYLEAVRQTQPVLLDTGVPPERLPYLNALAAKVNALVAAQGVDTTVQPDELHRMLRSGWGFVASEDGLVLPLNFGDVEVRIAFRPGDAVEVLDPPQRAAEVIQAQLPQFPKGNRILGATGHRSMDQSHDHPYLGSLLNAAGEAIPEHTPFDVVNAAREAMRRAVFKTSFGRGRRFSFRGDAFGRFTVPGQVADNRGDSTYYRVDGHYDVQIRRARPDAQWTSVERVDAAVGDDRTFFDVAVEHPYTEPAPQAQEQLPSAPRDRSFPAHSLVRLSGLEDIRETVLELLGPKRDDAWQQVHTMVREELPARLDHAIDHRHGFVRPIYSQGRPVALVRIQTVVTPGSAARIGTASDKLHLEQLRVSFAGYSGSAEWARTRHRGATAGMSVLPASMNPDGALPDGSLTTGYARVSSSTDGISTGATAIRPNVQRYTGRTQAYQLELVHTVTVQHLDGADSALVSRQLPAHEAIVRMPELDAYRHGFPVDQAALHRDAQGEKRYHSDGTAVLVDDLIPGAPPGRAAAPPAYLRGPGAIPGVGPALVSHLTGVEKTRRDLTAALHRRGWLPEQVDGWPQLSDNPMLATAELANVLELAELNGAFLEGAYEQAAQQGVPLVLTRHRVGKAPEHLTLRVQIAPDWDKAVLLGHRLADTDVSLDIGSHRFARKLGESVNRSLAPNLGVSGGAAGLLSGGPTKLGEGGFGGSGAHTLNSSVEYGDTVNHVKLVEGMATGYTATFRVPHRVSVVEVLPNGEESPPLVEAPGAAEVRISADLLPWSRPLAAPESAGPTSPQVLRSATLLHLDATGVWDKVRAVLPAATRPGAPSHDHLAAFVDGRSLMASPWWLYGEHGTQFAVDPRGEVPQRSSLWLRGRPGRSTFLTAARLVIGDVNLTMNADNVSFSQEGAATGTGSANIGADAVGSLGTSGNFDGSLNASRTSTRISGRERIAIENSLHYVFTMPVDIDVTGVAHRSPAVGGDATSSLVANARKVVYSVPERFALRLYADGELPVPQVQIADALRRWVGGTLELDRRTVVRVLSRLHQEHASAGGSTYLPGAVLSAADRLARRLVTELTQAFPDAVAPTGSRVGDQLKSIVDQGLALPEVTPGTAPVRIAEPLRNALGQGGIEPGAIFHRRRPDGSSETVSLVDELGRLVDQAVPDAMSRTPGLRQGLSGQFAAEGWTGKLDRMLAGGWEMAFPVRTRLGTELVQLRITATLSDGRFLGNSPTTGSVGQDYAYADHRLGQGYGRSSGGRLAGDANALPMTPEVGGGLGHGGSSWANTQRTRIQRVSTFVGGMERVARDLTLTIEVSRPRDGKASPVTGSLFSQVVHLVPPGMLVPDSQPAPSLDRPPADAPVSALPHRFFVETIRAHDLHSVIRGALAMPHVLGEKGVARHDGSLSRQLSALPVNVGLDRMSGPGGHPSVTLPKPGHPDRLVQVFIRAEPVGEPQPVVGGRDSVGLGQDDRSQHVMGQDSSRDRWRPATVSVSAEDPFAGSGVSGKVSGRDSSSHSYTLRRGDRDERKIYEEGTADTAAQWIRYHLTIVEKQVLLGGRERVIHREPVAQTPSGLAFLTMFDTDHAKLRGAHAAHDRDSLHQWIGDPVSPAGARRGWHLPPLRRARVPVMSLDALTDAVAARPDYDPARPHAAILGEIRQRLGERQWRNAPMLRLDASAPTLAGVDPAELARELAAERGDQVIIDVHHPDQTHRYHGHPPAQQ